jgi:hypothetical protein
MLAEPVNCSNPEEASNGNRNARVDLKEEKNEIE